MALPTVRMSEQIGDFAEAFAKAQAAIINPAKNRPVEVKTKDGARYTFAYATFDAILEVARPCLAANGIGYVQAPAFDERGNLVLMTTLIHSSGQWIEVPMPIIGAGGTPQSFGSALTYAKRYGFCAAVGIAADEDDDGAAAVGSTVKDARPAASGRATQPSRGSAVPAEGRKADPAPSAPDAGKAETVDERGKPDPSIDLYTLFWPADERGNRFSRTFPRSGSGIVELLGAMRQAIGSTAPKLLGEPENRMLLDQIRSWASESPKRAGLIEKIDEIEDLAANPPGAA